MQTKTFTVNSIGDPEPIITASACSLVTIREDPSVSGWPTVGYKVRAPLATDSPVSKEMGEDTIFTFEGGLQFKSKTGKWAKGVIIGYVETNSGSTTFSQVEE